MRQQSLFALEPTAIDPRFARARRIELTDGAWVEYVPSWLSGHERLFEEMARESPWQTARRLMYERMVDVPRLFARAGAHPMLDDIGARLSERYRLDLSSITLAYYRDGNDSVAMHGDRLGKLVDDTIVATVSLGSPRRFTMRAKSGAESRSFNLGFGDLLVMGGSCQSTWQHGVPKVARADPRISVMFRPVIPSDVRHTFNYVVAPARDQAKEEETK
jgi:alkylated DNA repair dioxygenase AlkB